MLFDPLQTKSLSLKNRAVMSPMTRSRAIGNVPNDLMAQYYGQRASAGLIVTEGTSPSPNGLGYPRIPGIFSQEQADGWKLVTDSVHAKGSKIFVQFMHSGRVGHVDNLPPRAELVSSTDELLVGEIYTDTKGLQPNSPARKLHTDEIASVIAEHVNAAKLAISAGFDGVELHGANGYLIEQFLNANINKRDDQYGGSAENRNRFALEVAKAVIDAIGADKVGIRLSPYGAAQSTGEFDGIQEQYISLVRSLSDLGLVYVHLVDHSAMGAPPVPADFKLKLSHEFKGVFILAGGFNLESAEKALSENQADLIGFGRPFLANPDLLERFKAGAALNEPDFGTFYSPGEKGYTDYPTLG
jgi:N-ethylmaleimide reductase